LAHSLRGEGFDASEDGTGRGTPLVPVAFGAQNSAAQGDDVCEDYCPPLSCTRTPAVAFGGGVPTTGFQGDTAFGAGDVWNCLGAGGGNNGGGAGGLLVEPWSVRRLTPRECERLQGFPDDYTAIPWRGKPADQCPDGPRYKALGNSMAVPVMAWILRRLADVDALNPTACRIAPAGSYSWPAAPAPAGRAPVGGLSGGGA
jgi:DNA (cytosine-5)-methyltransferase 1